MAVEERPALNPLAPSASEHEAHKQAIASDDLLIISVGSRLDEAEFHLPKSLACTRSPVLASACESYLHRFPNCPMILHFKNFLPYCFSIYHTWLMTSALTPSSTHSNSPVRRHSKESFTLPICAYIIGSQMKDATLRDAAIEKCCEIHQREGIIPSIYHVEHVWEQTDEEAMLRVWMLDVWSVDVDEEVFVELMDELPGSFVREVVRRIFKLRERAKRGMRMVDEASSYVE
ncbi:hypothetical protein DOTSEDRAFT_57089 [Dothistroma septosporum NZE10]|uniref:BTB domain-containing protein n=1 Tax=Dothistroma septosporum (strain NZE10 / CBS 128990) TaxID=675120 RepID=M2YIH5_DOTSN|nr:hypothetical protein DOTSEDRAFT_57089 [Dothistroma septosporum NZE10]